MNSSSANTDIPVHLTSIRPKDFLRIDTGDRTTLYKVLVNRSGIRLRPANRIEALGTMLGASLAYRQKPGDRIRMLGLVFVVDVEPDGGMARLVAEDQDLN